MDVSNVLDKEMNKFVNNKSICGVLLVGALAKTNISNVNKLRDIDIFVVTNSINKFEREVVIKEGIEFDISYISLDLLQKGLEEMWPFLMNSLFNYKLVYSTEPQIEKLLSKIQNIKVTGPKELKEEEIKYVRFTLYQLYKDIITRKFEEMNVIFLTYNLFNQILDSFFKLNKLWIPKDKKKLNIIKEEDKELYSLCIKFIREENIDKKIRALYEVLNYVLIPFGGILEYWEKSSFPLK